MKTDDNPTTGEQGFHALECQYEITEIERLNAALAAERSERCEVCNGELSQCGVQGVDGEPSLDCRYCKLKDQLDAERKRIAMHVRNWEKMLDDKEQQLAAAVEALKLAALFVSDGYNAGCPSRTRVRETIDAALAKIGEWK